MGKSLPMSVLQTLPHIDEAAVDVLLTAELAAMQQTVVVLDDDPTGIQTVHGVYVYTDWSEETLTEALGEYLETIGLDEYNSWEIAKKTQGRMAEDQQRIEIGML